MAGSTVLQYLEYILTNNWETTVPGRNQDVPEPNVVIAADTDFSRVNFQNDQIFVRKGGAESHSPKSMGWEHKEIENMVTLDIRTVENRERLEGTRTEQNEPEAYGGLQGEVERILDTKRRGDKEFDWIEGYEWNDLSEEVGHGNWRGEWEIRLTQIAQDIEPEL